MPGYNVEWYIFFRLFPTMQVLFILISLQGYGEKNLWKKPFQPVLLSRILIPQKIKRFFFFFRFENTFIVPEEVRLDCCNFRKVSLSFYKLPFYVITYGVKWKVQKMNGLFFWGTIISKLRFFFHLTLCQPWRSFIGFHVNDTWLVHFNTDWNSQVFFWSKWGVIFR